MHQRKEAMAKATKERWYYNRHSNQGNTELVPIWVKFQEGKYSWYEGVVYYYTAVF